MKPGLKFDCDLVRCGERWITRFLIKKFLQELPVDATFTKPVRIEALLAKVRQLLPAASAHF